ELPSYDIVTIFCDSLNYLESPEEVKQTFHGVYRHLNPNGLLLFDVHSIYQMDHGFIDQTFTLNEDEIVYIWNSFQGEQPYSVEHDLTFFVLDESTGQYNRIEELHQQRTYPVNDIREWLVGAGFDV